VLVVIFSILNTLGNGKDRTLESKNATVSLVESVENISSTPADFVRAAKVSAPAVVHIKSRIKVGRSQYRAPDPFRDFFDDDFWERFFGVPRDQETQRFAEASGSGVIIDQEGYIVTNNHVIDRAEEIEVVLHDQRSYVGKVIGTDPLTDLALLKIEESELPFLGFANSDQSEVGEWVLAVGNPFYNLSSTVTAGIISAKARNINILQDQAAIESFIQTDAAVNRGNSGGALVNTQGALIGINTAIASPTGVYAGYSFAIPSNIVKKVVDDLLKYGVVQRAYLGVIIRNLDGQLIKDLKLNDVEGVLVDSLVENGAGMQAGIHPNDIIIMIGDHPIKNVSQLQAKIGTHRPGDQVKITLLRDGKKKHLNATLKNISGSTAAVMKENKDIIDVLGAEFTDLSSLQKEDLGIENGVQVGKIHSGKLKNNTDIKEGFVITKVDDEPIRSVTQLKEMMEKKEGGVMLEGVYPGREGTYYYAFGMN
ncbi:MAG: Do family serine endopeptidase, partial [Cyclobacteriaceae bacterium]